MCANDFQNGTIGTARNAACQPLHERLLALQGDAINTASRMESKGFPMTIHVSDAVFNGLRDPDMLAPCGQRAIKGKGDMHTFLVKV